jgi:large subunit ribosomal protein L17
MLRNQATALLRYEHLTTTVPRAKELRPFVERIITIAKRSLAVGANGMALHARRLVMHDLQDQEVVAKLFDTLAPRFVGRPGGYTRLLRLGFRKGDAAEIAQVELVGSEFTTRAKAETEAKGEGAGPKKAKGVSERLRAAAERLRSRGKEGRGRTRREAGQAHEHERRRRRQAAPEEARAEGKLGKSQVSRLKSQPRHRRPLGPVPNAKAPDGFVSAGAVCVFETSDLRLQTFILPPPPPPPAPPWRPR